MSKLPTIPVSAKVTTELLRDENARHRVFLAVVITTFELTILFAGVSLTTHMMVALGVFGKDIVEIMLDMLDSDL